MRTFSCECGNTVYFLNSLCLDCRRELGYIPGRVVMAALEDAGNGRVRALHPKLGGEATLYRKCRNWTEHEVCNWLVDDADPSPFCESCRLNRIIPNLSVEGNGKAWYQLECAKRRLLYGLRTLRLPVFGKRIDPRRGLAFAFMADHPDKNTYFETLGGQERVLTGHALGLVTINIAEADDASRELMRARMDEPYRTLLGHFRHEVGHYYWDLLVRDSAEFRPEFDRLFGPLTQNYGEALERYYAEGPAREWRERFISPYATAHPWEDWAETWAHYLHMMAAMETACYHGVLGMDRGTGIRPLDLSGGGGEEYENTPLFSRADFDKLVADWIGLSVAMNGINLSVGHDYLYPFVLTPPVVEKLRFIHAVVGKASRTEFAKA